ncbi:MAG: FAD-dependent oxidoreductase [Cyanobacteria bacterium SZAS LIN-5]|nr:FAD-dependent oxidoreductase [Cyanobacteria bacterium SZAS LIN-5]
MKSIAVVGTGIAGLACAYMLRKNAKLTVFEQNDYIGGHTNTIYVEEDGKTVSIDTGFMVYNEVTYPYLTKLFKELNIKSQPTDMSFSVQNRALNLEWSGTGFNRIFGERKNILNLRFWKMLLELDRFNKTALAMLSNESISEYTLNEFIAREKFSDDMVNLYLLPMMSALWSAPPATMLSFPASVLIRFMFTHGLLSMYGKLDWLTVSGGASTYVKAMTESFRDSIQIGAKVVAVSPTRDGRVAVRRQDGTVQEFDQCILACHGDQAFEILDSSFTAEKVLLENFKYQANTILVHKDQSVMPKNKINWASWNYLVDTKKEEAPTTTHYWMNSLQKVSDRYNYFVSLNSEALIEPSKIVRRIQYHHPIFTVAAKNAQKQLKELNKTPLRNLFLCGSYFSHGFHEDALASSIDVVNLIQGVANERHDLLFV